MVSVGWHHTGLDLRDGGLHVILVLVVGSAGPHVNLAGGGGRGQYRYCVHLTVHIEKNTSTSFDTSNRMHQGGALH